MTKRMEATGATAESNKELLRLFISTTVPLLIMEYEQRGGIDQWDIKWLEQQGEILGSGGDVILCYEKGKSSRMIGILCRCLAIMAFFPGGVKIFGLHFEAKQVIQGFESLRAHILQSIQGEQSTQ